MSIDVAGALRGQPDAFAEKHLCLESMIYFFFYLFILYNHLDRLGLLLPVLLYIECGQMSEPHIKLDFYHFDQYLEYLSFLTRQFLAPYLSNCVISIVLTVLTQVQVFPRLISSTEACGQTKL